MDKAQLLAAIAAAGTQGRVDYEQAQAANSAAQHDALRAALSQSIAMGAPQGANDEISRIIGQPYQVSNERLAANAQAQETWMNHAKWNSGVFQGNVERLRDALIAQTLAEQAAGGGSGGGGGGGGGGSDPGDWYENLKDSFGTAALGFDAIGAEAKALGLHKWSNTGMSPHAATAKFAEENYGVPAGVAASKYTQPKDDVKFEAEAKSRVASVKNKKSLKKFTKGLRATAKSIPGNQKYITSKFKAQAKSQVQAKRKRRRK